MKKLLIANRGEIAIRIMRAASELGITTVAIFTYEDRYALHRYKADEAYQIGADDDPLKPYLDYNNIVRLAKEKGCDGVHPGYGFLSENVLFAELCRKNGIVFVGPSPEAMRELGDKVAAKNIAIKNNIPIIPDSREDLSDFNFAFSEAQRIGFPVMIKAAAGGGGRGMRVVREKELFGQAYNEARNEAKNAFGDDTLFLEKFIDTPRHIEVQLLGDNYGNLVHLYERDCSVQRRFQKVVEIAPSFGLKEETRQQLYHYAIAIGKAVNYSNAGTVEFLVDEKENVYFIEVNPRIQVEHTVTEEITSIDIVRSQIQIAQGNTLQQATGITTQKDVIMRGCAIQCRITTEDPSNGFKPDFGTIIAYRNAAGYGIRLDEGNAFAGMKISPYFDSMILKVTARGRTLQGATQRLRRALIEFRIRGVKTNIPFLLNVIQHPIFLESKVTVKFIESHPELFKFKILQDRSTRLLKYIANVIVNGQAETGKTYIKPSRIAVVPKPLQEVSSDFKGYKPLLQQLGPEKFAQHIKKEKSILYTDTTFRDAHQSLLATRVRTKDMLEVASGFANDFPHLFSMEVWGGATFDVSMRFLNECPWKRLQAFKKAMPNTLLQMLFRGSNAVGYSAYPNNLIEKFIEESAMNGIDVFRIFDSLNWIESMKISISAVRKYTKSIAEASICYTGDILDKNQTKYTLKYYIDFAKQLEQQGAHILAIKDMAGLLKPYAAEKLISELKKNINIPIHLHTHDTSGIQSATYLKAIETGVDIIDCCLAGLSGLTSQPNLNSIVAMMQNNERECPIHLNQLNKYSNYWEDIRELYAPFESGLKASTAEVYDHEIPGGQYSNLRPQAIGLGLIDRFDELKQNYAVVNKLFGDIVKVTPSSKVVGDMALFMMANHLTEDNLFDKGQSVSFPESVKDFFKGYLGQPYGGFPKQLQQLILKNETSITGNPNDSLPPLNIDEDFKTFVNAFPHNNGITDYLSYKMYPKVYETFYKNQEEYSDVSILPTSTYWYGLKPNEEILVKIDEGKTILIRYLYMTEADDLGYRSVSFQLNGQNRRIRIKDNSKQVKLPTNKKASQPNEVGSPLQGRISRILVKNNERIIKNAPLFIIESMKMESTVTAPADGVISDIILKAGAIVEQGDMVIELKAEA